MNVRLGQCELITVILSYTTLDDATEPNELPEINRLSKAELVELVRERTA